MKFIFRPRISGLGFLIAVVGVCLVVSNARALNAENPYGPIVSRNVFGLKPPTVTAPPPVAPVAAAVTFKLLGISTILDRKQVLLKIITAARPPAVAKEQSYLWGEGQGEDEIEVVAIDAVLGIVTIKNRGETVPLTMKENAEKPAVGAALPLPSAPSTLSPQLPGQLPPPPVGAGAVAPTGGGAPRTIPTRSLRTSTTDGAGLGAVAAPGGWGSANRATLPSAAQAPSPNDASSLPYDAQMALIEIQRERTKDAVQAGRLPPLPPISFPQK